MKNVICVVYLHSIDYNLSDAEIPQYLKCFGLATGSLVKYLLLYRLTVNKQFVSKVLSNYKDE